MLLVACSSFPWYVFFNRFPWWLVRTCFLEFYLISVKWHMYSIHTFDHFERSSHDRLLLVTRFQKLWETYFLISYDYWWMSVIFGVADFCWTIGLWSIISLRYNRKYGDCKLTLPSRFLALWDSLSIGKPWILWATCTTKWVCADSIRMLGFSIPYNILLAFN
jgi:hypothetical protein